MRIRADYRDRSRIAACDEQMLIRIPSLCDAHLILRIEQVGERLVKIMEVAKVRNAMQSTGNIISFDVEPGLGMKIIPISKAKA
jgi:flagellar protein FlaH